MNIQIHIKYGLFAFLFIYTEGGCFGQQETAVTQFWLNPIAYNAGAAASRDVPSLVLHTRYQWLGIKGAPQQQSLSFNTPFLSKRLGMGTNLTNRKVGINENQTFSLAFNYALFKNAVFAVRIGLQGQVRRWRFKFDDAQQLVAMSGDESLMNVQPRTVANIGSGIYISYRDNYFGLGVPMYIENTISNNPNSPKTATETSIFYAIGGLHLPLSGLFSIQTNGIVRITRNVPFNLDANANIVYGNKMSAGISFRSGKTNYRNTGESVAFNVFYYLTRKIGVGVSYDKNVSPLSTYAPHSIEAALRYDFRKQEIEFSNPRVFF